MTTWNSITIERPGALTLDTLPDALTGDAEIWEDRDQDDERVTIPERQIYAHYTRPERPGKPDGNITIEGRSKWRPEEAIAALVELSKTTGRITHHQQWDDDGQGEEISVYENGAEVEAERLISDMVPARLPALLVTLREALNSPNVYPQNGRYHQPTVAVIEAARALVDALLPETVTQ